MGEIYLGHSTREYRQREWTQRFWGFYIATGEIQWMLCPSAKSFPARRRGGKYIPWPRWRAGTTSVRRWCRRTLASPNQRRKPGLTFLRTEIAFGLALVDAIEGPSKRPRTSLWLIFHLNNSTKPSSCQPLIEMTVVCGMEGFHLSSMASSLPWPSRTSEPSSAIIARLLTRRVRWLEHTSLSPFLLLSLPLGQITPYLGTDPTIWKSQFETSRVSAQMTGGFA